MRLQEGHLRHVRGENHENQPIQAVIHLAQELSTVWDVLRIRLKCEGTVARQPIVSQLQHPSGLVEWETNVYRLLKKMPLYIYIFQLYFTARVVKLTVRYSLPMFQISCTYSPKCLRERC